MLSGAQLSMPAKIAASAKSYGFCSCAKSMAAFLKGVTYDFQEDIYEIEIDGSEITCKNGSNQLKTGFLVVNNGKYTGSGAVFNPYGVINDGFS